MGCVNCENAKDLVRIWLFEKSCHYLKKLQFSIIVFKNRFYWYREKMIFLRHFWFRTSCIGYVNCDSVK